MMDPLQTIIADMKSSTRASDRKSASQRLVDYLDGDMDDVCLKLDLNSVNSSDKRNCEKMTWTRLFMEVRDYFKKETEKGSVTSVNKLTLFGVVNKVFTQATRNRPWLPWNKVLDFILSNLQSDKHAIFIGPNLINMLERYLKIDLYKTVMDANSWIDLINTLIRCSGKFQISLSSLLGCLKVCIEQGSLYGPVISTLRSNVVNFYVKIIQTKPKEILQDILPYLQGATSLSKLNACEFRGILCQFGETVIPHILQSQSFTDEKESTLLEFLLVQFCLHMPCDVEMNSEAFYADDSEKWKEIVRLMYSYCIDIIEDVATKRTSHSDVRVQTDLLKLAAKCTKQISSPLFLENPNSDDEDIDAGLNSKKKMRYKSFHTIISDVHCKQPSDGLMTWLKYFTAVLNKFPQLVESRINFSNLIHLGNSLYNTKYMLRREFYLFFTSLLNVERHLKRTGKINDVTETWITLWDLTIKSISVSEEKKEAINLLRNLLKEVHPSNVISLLRLYINSYMPFTEESVELLLDYLSLCSLPTHLSSSNLSGTQSESVDEEFAATPCTRLELLKWLITLISNDVSGYEPIIAKAMCSLVVKQSHILLQGNSLVISSDENSHMSFETLLIQSCFLHPDRRDTKESLNKDEKTNTGANGYKFIMEKRPAERLASVIKSDQESSLVLDPSSTRSDSINDYRRFTSRLRLYMNVLNVIEKSEVEESSFNIKLGLLTTLEKVCDSGLSKCVVFIMGSILPSNHQNNAGKITKMIKASRVLFSVENMCDKLRILVVQKFSHRIEEVFKRIFRNNLARYVERYLNNSHESNVVIMDPELPSTLRCMQLPNAVELELITRVDRSCEKMSLEALNILIDYGLINNQRQEFFTELTRDLSSESFCNANQFVFDSVAVYISKVAKAFQSLEFQDLIDPLILLLQKCCRGFFLFPNCSEILWSLFKEMIPVVAKGNEDYRKNFVILVGTLHNFLKQENQVPKYVYIRALEALAELSKHDEKLLWTIFTPKQAPPIWILEEVSTLLSNRSHEVKMRVVETICCMYQHAYAFDYTGGIASSQSETSADGLGDEYQERRKSCLDRLFQQFLNSFDIPNDISDEEKKEESINRTSLLLSCFAGLIFAFPYTQRQTLMFLFTAMKLKNIDIDLANRALQYVSNNSAKTMCCYFPYILKKSLKLKSTLEDLPFKFFDCNDYISFLRKFQYAICVEYFEQDRMSDLEIFASRLNLNMQTLITECYGLVMARITPGLAKHPSTRGINFSVNNEIHKRLIYTLGGKDVTDTLMATCLGDVVLNLISMIFEPSIVNTWNCIDVKLSEPVPPHYPESTIDECLQFLKKASPTNNLSVIGYLARTSHHSIYKILLSLTMRIHDSPDELQKYWRLHQFAFFVNQLLNEPEDSFLHMKEYVCNFVFNTYMRLLKLRANESNEDKQLRFLKVILLLIYQLVKRLTELYSDEMAIFFTPVVRSIVSITLKHEELLESTKAILDFLLKRHGETYSSCIESLDPFPLSVCAFQDYQTIHINKKYGNNRRQEWSLSKELERLLKQSRSNGITKGSCTKESLRFLRELLSTKKRDLERMVKNLESIQFSEGCATDPLHSIIQMLTSIAISSNKDPDIIAEACKCLGEIGPIDLSVLVLPPFKSQGKIFRSDTALPEIIKIILGYQTSDDIRIVSVSGKILRKLYQYKQCTMALNNDFKDSRLLKILSPFRSNQTTLRMSDERVDASLLEIKLGLNEMNEAIDFRSWLTQLTTGVIACFTSKSSFLTDLLPLCELRADFCEDIFPYVVYLCLFGGNMNPMVRKTLSGYFRSFFMKFVGSYNNATESSRSYTPSSNGSSQTIIYLNKMALRLLIRVIQFLRRNPSPRDTRGSLRLTPWDNNFWLDVNYLDIARAAQYCGAYLTSLLFVEIAATEMDLTRPSSQSQYSDEYGDDSQDESLSQGGSLYPRNKSEAFKMEKLLLKAYSSIGEMDSAYGCGSARFADTQSSMHHLEQTMDWHRLLMLSNGSSITNDGQDHLQTCSEQHVALSLKQLGLQNILWTYLKGVEVVGMGLPDDLAQAQYECGWRLGRWDLQTDKPTYLKNTSNDGSQQGFQACIYHGIQSGIAKDFNNCNKAVLYGFKTICTELRHATLESAENLYGFLSRFQMLRVVEDFFNKDAQDECVQIFLRKWKGNDRTPAADFKYQEPGLYLRNVLLRAYDQKHARANLENEINESLLEIISKARNAGRLDLAESCATAMNGLYSKPLIALEFEIAKNHWARGNRDIARDITNKLIKKSNHEDDLFPAFLLVYGDWLSISHCERPSAILEKYLQRSCTIYEKRDRASADLSKAYIVVAKYADAQYQNVMKYQSSDVFQSKVSYLERAKKDEQLVLQSNMDKDSKNRSVTINRKQRNNDADEICHIEKEKRKFLQLALRQYLKGLKLSSENDLLIFRAISLWLENGHDTDDNLIEATNRIVRDEILPSYKYVVVLHQLSARLSSTFCDRNEILKTILMKCAQDHPYHTLPVLLTQALLHKDQVLPKSNSSAKIQPADRVQAAAAIVNTLKKNSPLKNLVSRMEHLWFALIELANIPDQERNVDGKKKDVPTGLLKRLTNLETVAVPTSGIPILQSTNYKDIIVGISKFDKQYGLVGGINSPKKICCWGINGKVFNMLLKGQDDLRQDAVMQQVFGVLNSLLQFEPKTKQRRLHIRTYKVIPLSQRTGVIEWVEDTQTFGDYLVGGAGETNVGAHVRYRQSDYKPIECRKIMMDEAKKSPPDPMRKLSTYMTICEHFKPVFRHFFFENFKEAGVFFEKRLAYTRSVATCSIVGYILGLGDRHVLNILIDKITAEFVHIDLGVAFEQGRILPTPETVPFRLTRDVIDGMGISGVEGVFRKSCEETMHVLRNNAEIIITVLQVLLYDPLYMWALTTDRVAKVQPSDSSRFRGPSKGYIEPQEDSVKERNNSASRVLLRLRQKLMGIEEEGGATGAISSGSSLSVDGHVSLLIQRAVDPEKLCRLFAGWQPYL